MRCRKSFRLDILRYLTREDGAKLAPKIRAYRRELDGYLHELRAAGAAADCREIERTAHQLASHFAALGHDRLLAQTQRIEATAIHGELAGVRPRLAQLSARILVFQRQLRASELSARRRQSHGRSRSG